MTVTRTSLNSIASATNASSYNSGSCTPTAGRVGLAFVVNDVSSGTATAVSAITGNNGQAWEQISTLTVAQRRVSLFMARFDNTAAGVINVAFGGVTQQGCMASFWEIASDVAGAILQLVAAPVTNSGSAGTTGEAALSGSGTYAMLGIAHLVNAATITAEGGWDQIHQDVRGAEAGRFITMEDFGGADLTPFGTWATPSNWMAIGALFEETVVEGPIALAQEGSGTNAGNTTATLTFTGTITKGELMIALFQVAHFAAYSISTVPPGWKVVTGLSALEFGADANWDLYVYVKRAGISEPLTHQWITNGSNCIVHGGRFTGVKSLYPVQTDTEYNSAAATSLVEGASPNPGANALWFIGWAAKHFEGAQVPVTFTDSGAAVTKEDQLNTTGGTKNESAWGHLTKNGTINITSTTGVAVTGHRLVMAAFLEGLVDTDIDLTPGTGDGGDPSIALNAPGFTHLGGAHDSTGASSYNKTVSLAGGGVLWVAVVSRPLGSAANTPTLTLTGATFTLVHSGLIEAWTRLSVFYSQDYDPGDSQTLGIAFSGQTQDFGIMWSAEEQIPGYRSGDPVAQLDTSTPGGAVSSLAGTLVDGAGDLLVVTALRYSGAVGVVTPGSGSELTEQNGFSSALEVYWDADVQTDPQVAWSGSTSAEALLIALEALVVGAIGLTPGSGDGGAATIDIEPVPANLIDLDPGAAAGGAATLEINPFGSIDLTPGAAAGGNGLIRIRIPGEAGYEPGAGDAVRRPPRTTRPVRRSIR